VTDLNLQKCVISVTQFTYMLLVYNAKKIVRNYFCTFDFRRLW